MKTALMVGLLLYGGLCLAIAGHKDDGSQNSHPFSGNSKFSNSENRSRSARTISLDNTLAWSTASLCQQLNELAYSNHDLNQKADCEVHEALRLLETSDELNGPIVTELSRLASDSDAVQLLLLNDVFQAENHRTTAERERILAVVLDSSERALGDMGVKDIEDLSPKLWSWLDAYVNEQLGETQPYATWTINNKDRRAGADAEALTTIGPLCLLSKSLSEMRNSGRSLGDEHTSVLNRIGKFLFDPQTLKACERYPVIWPYIEAAWTSFHAAQLSDSYRQSVPLNIRPAPAIDDGHFAVDIGVEGDAANASARRVTGIAGIKLVFSDSTVDRRVDAFARQRRGIERVIMEADEITIDRPLSFIGANVEIFARSLKITEHGSIDTSGDAGTDSPDGSASSAGMPSGSITIYAAHIMIDAAKDRTQPPLRLCGGDGRNSGAGPPAPGGNGGTLSLNANLFEFVEGSKGATLFRNYGGLGGRSLNAFGPVGLTGASYLNTAIGDPVRWLTPAVAQCRLRYVEALYLHEGDRAIASLQSVTQLCRDIRMAAIKEDGNHTLKTVLDRAEVLRQQMLRGLDFYGNPPGWTPQLSSQKHQQLFADEIVPAIRMIGLLSRVQANWTKKLHDADAIAKLSDHHEREARRLLEEAARLTGADETPPFKTLSDLRADIAACVADSEELAEKIKQRLDHLNWQAQDQVKVPFWKKGLNILGSVCSIVPIPAVAVAGNVLAKVTADDTNQDYAKSVQSTAKSVSELYGLLDSDDPDSDKTNGKNSATDESKSSENRTTNGQDLNKDADKGTVGVQQSPQEAQRSDVDSAAKTADKLVNGAKQVVGLIESTKGMFAPVPASKYAAILEQLKQSDGPYKDLVQELERLTIRKTKVQERLNALVAEFTQKTAQASQYRAQSIALQRALGGTAFQLPTLETITMVELLKDGAIARLQKFHYYAARAYAHRLLQPYPVSFDVVNLHNMVVKGLSEAGSPPDTSAKIEDKVAEIISEEVRSKVVEHLIEHIGQFGPETSINVTVSISDNRNAELLNRLNNDRELEINLTETPWLDPFVDDQMICGRITSIDCAPSGIEIRTDELSNPNVQVRIFAPKQATLVRGGSAFTFWYDKSYYEPAIAIFSVTPSGVTSDKKWSTSLDEDIFESLAANSKEKSKKLSQFLKWPGADSTLRITLNQNSKAMLRKLEFSVVVQGFADSEKDRRVRVRTALLSKDGTTHVMPGVAILELGRRTGSISPAVFVRDKYQKVSLVACPFFGDAKLSYWMIGDRKVSATVGMSLDVDVLSNYSIEAIYERERDNAN